MRFQLLLLAALYLPACAHNITEPVSQANDLVTLITGENHSAGCPEWVKLEGTITDHDDFVRQMAACRDRSVVVEINSPGGSVFDALEIQKAIERHPHPVVCLVDGMAASAAFVTLQSCDIRLMTDRSILMAHHAAIRAGGQKEQLDNAAAALRAIDRGMALRCAKRMQMNPDDFDARTSGGKEWWMGVEDAAKFKAIDFEVQNINDALNLARTASR